MRRTGATAVAVLAIFVGAAMPALPQTGAAPTWKGAYRSEFDGGRTAGAS